MAVPSHKVAFGGILAVLTALLLLDRSNYGVSAFPASAPNNHGNDILFFRISAHRTSYQYTASRIQINRNGVYSRRLILASSSGRDGEGESGTPETEGASTPASPSDSTSDNVKKSIDPVSLQRLQLAYRGLGYGFWIAAFGHAVHCFRYPSARALPHVTGTIAGYLIVASLCHSILQPNAASPSDTYCRLNTWGLGFFGLVQLPAVYTSTSVTTCLTLLRLATVATAFARRRLVPSPSSTFSIQSTWRSWRVRDKRRALTYRNCSLLFVLGMCTRFWSMQFALRYRGLNTSMWLASAAQWEAAARCGVLATMAHVLQDAAERDRLSGTTFTRLNLLVAFWALAVTIGQAMNPWSRAHWGAECLALAGPFLLGAYKGQRAKKLLAKQGPM